MPKLKLNPTNHILPWLCFNIPTTTTTSSSSSDNIPSTNNKKINTTCIKLIMFNGQVKTYHHPVPASDLMSEFPSHLVCHSDSFLVGQKVPALDPSDTLEVGNSYFLLPSAFFRSVLSLVSISSSFSPSDRAALLKMVEVQRTPSGKLRIRVNDEFMERSVDDDDDQACGSRGGRGRVCSTVELERVYKGMVKRRGEGWRPKLETIKEKEGRKKEKRTKKTKDPKAYDKTQSKSRDKMKGHIQDRPPPPPPPPPPPKVAKTKKKDKDDDKKKMQIFKEKVNIKSSKEAQLQEDEHDDNSHSMLPPPLMPQKASKSKSKVRKDKKKPQLQHKGSHQHTPPPPPPPPPLSPTPPRGPFAAMKAKIKEKKKQREKKENEKNR